MLKERDSECRSQLLYETKGSWIGVPAVGPTRTDGTSFNSVQKKSEKYKWVKNLRIMNALLGTHLEMCLKLEIVVGSPQLHGLSDTGELGYGGALFLQIDSLQQFVLFVLLFKICTIIHTYILIQQIHSYYTKKGN